MYSHYHEPWFVLFTLHSTTYLSIKIIVLSSRIFINFWHLVYIKISNLDLIWIVISPPLLLVDNDENCAVSLLYLILMNYSGDSMYKHLSFSNI